MSTTFKATIEHVNHTTSRASVRTHTGLVDRGIAKGGLDLGPAGGEYLLVSLGGTPERFTAFTMDVSAECQDSAIVRKLITIAARSRQVTNTLGRVASIAITYDGSPVELSEAATVG